MNDEHNREINFNSLEHAESNEFDPSQSSNSKINPRQRAVFSGVCFAIGKHFNIDPFLIRVAFIFSLFLGIWGVVTYVVAAVILTKNDYFLTENDNSKTKSRPFKLTAIFLLALFLLLVFYISDFLQFLFQPNIFGFSENLIISIFLIAAGILIFVKRKLIYSNVPLTNPQFLYRSINDKKIAGVCGGIANYFNQDSNFIRLLCILFSFVTAGLGLIIYLIFITIVPTENLMEDSDAQ
jgi:phage shock protein C